MQKIEEISLSKSFKAKCYLCLKHPASYRVHYKDGIMDVYLCLCENCKNLPAGEIKKALYREEV